MLDKSQGTQPSPKTLLQQLIPCTNIPNGPGNHDSNAQKKV